MGSRGPIAKKRQRTAQTAAGVRLRPLPEDADAIGGAFVSDYKIDASDPLGMITWSATLAVSGAPVRT